MHSNFNNQIESHAIFVGSIVAAIYADFFDVCGTHGVVYGDPADKRLIANVSRTH